MRKWIVALLAALMAVAGLAVLPANAASGSSCENGVALTTHPDPATAKAKYVLDCGIPFQESTSFSCDWVDTGWRCKGPNIATSSNNTVSGNTSPPSDPAKQTSQPKTESGTTNNAGSVQPIPGAPGRLDTPQITSVKTSKRVATITWTPVAGAAGYEIFRDGRPSKTVYGTSHTDITPGQQNYKFQVGAFDQSRTKSSERSPVEVANTATNSNRTTGKATAAPTQTNQNQANAGETDTKQQATNGKLATPTITNVRTERQVAYLTWTPVEGAAGYDVFRNGKWNKTIMGNNTYRDGTPQATDYTYEVNAFDGAKKNFSDRSQKVTANTRGNSNQDTSAQNTSDNGSDSGSEQSSDDSTGVTAVTPRFKTLGVNDGLVKIIIHPVPSGTKISVFRNGAYVATLQNGATVVNDNKGKNGDTYRLVAERNGVEVGRTEQIVSATGGEGTAKSVLKIPEGMELHWTPQPGYTYSIYRKDSGGTVGYNQGARLATRLTRSPFVDQNPKRGASYGIVGKTIAGNLTPVLTVKPDYNRPVVSAVPQAFENGFYLFGKGLRLSPAAKRCDDVDKVPNIRYCQVSGPGQYKVTHLASQKSWTVDVKGPSPIKNKFVVVNGVKVLMADTNYGSILVLKNDAELEAVTGRKAPNSGATTRSRSFSGAVDGYPPTKKYFHYSVPLPIGVSPQEVSANIGVIHVNEYTDDGSVGREVGHWVDGNYYNPEQYDQLVADRARNGVYYTTKGGLTAVQMTPWGQARKWTTKAAWDILGWALDTFVGPDRVKDDDDDDDNSPFCSGGSNCHNGIELNEKTDPDGDGLSVFGDDDNDNDGHPTWEDDDDTNPNCHTNCRGGQTGGNNDSGDSSSQGSNTNSSGNSGGEVKKETIEQKLERTGGF